MGWASSWYSKAKYVGNCYRLRDKTAMIKQAQENDTVCQAQFDDLSLRESHGWHSFKHSDFIFGDF